VDVTIGSTIETGRYQQKWRHFLCGKNEKRGRLMDFDQFNSLLQAHVEQLLCGKSYAYVVDLESVRHIAEDTLWNTYLDSFPPGTNNVFRERREFDCTCCRHFIRDFGRVVSIDDGVVTSIWDFDTKSVKFQPVVDALSALVKSRPIANIFVPTSRTVGTRVSRDTVAGSPYSWYHLYVVLPSSILHALPPLNELSVGAIQGDMRDTRNVFQRSLNELSGEAVDTVLELIAQKSLYKGEEWETILTEFRGYQKEYSKLSSESQQDLYCWERAVAVGPVIGRIRNHSMGVLLTDISEGKELDDAVRRYEALVAPSNYKRPRPVFTKRMVQDAQKKVRELGLEDSLARRFAQLEDVSVANTLFANRSARRIMSGNVFDELAEEVPDRPKNLSKVEEIDIGTFVRDVLPKVSEMDVLLENRHESNLMSLVAPQNADSPSLFKWQSNGFSWAYSGNITDSMKERVKQAGGKVDGVLRFSIQWNDDGDNLDDLDAHCVEPSGFHIYFGNKRNLTTRGNLDVDIIHPQGVAVENITWPALRDMEVGRYAFFVRNFCARADTTSGFSAEIEFDGQIHTFDYPMPLVNKQDVDVALVNFDGKEFSIISKWKSQQSSKEIWGLQTQKFHPVTIMTLSPNYWDGRSAGNKHYFFFLDKCRNTSNPSGFFNEFLQDAFQPHRKVFEALTMKMRVPDSDTQLSGLGFSTTKRAQVVVRLRGNFERMLKVNF
jgi:hypothetical protein